MADAVRDVDRALLDEKRHVDAGSAALLRKLSAEGKAIKQNAETSEATIKARRAFAAPDYVGERQVGPKQQRHQ